jgi:tRNA-splicing ligase RtcB
MPIKKVLSETRVPVKVWTDDVEDEAVQQLKNTANMPFVFKHVAAMPDVHFGRGATIGSVIATKGAIIPAAVGVDIGCGMAALKLPFSIDTLGGDARVAELRHSIERAIPVGPYGYKELDEMRTEAVIALGENSLHTARMAPGENERIIKNGNLQLGTLGGGNHFIEICRDQQNMTWIMLHSGSRNIGKCLAERHIDKAKDVMKKYFISLPDPDLAYLAQGTPEFQAYLADLLWAQSYAQKSREVMMHRVLEQVWRHVYGYAPNTKMVMPTLFRVDCHHNYTKQENHFGANVYVTRKGAVSARDGEFGIIPGSMGTKSYIVKGKGNAESFCSCSHGAGRRMSRTKAKQMFTTADLEQQTAGVHCRKDADVVDEIPGAYKSIDQVMESQTDLVDVMFELKQLICIKG